MRTEIGEIDLSGEVPPELLSKNASNDMMLFTALISLFIAAAMIYLGKKSGHYWMIFWSVGLIIMSLFAASAIIFELDGLH